MSDSSQQIPPESLAAGYEFRDVRPKPMLVFLICFILTIAIVHAIGLAVLLWMESSTTASNLRNFPPHAIPAIVGIPGPALEPQPAHDVPPNVDLQEVQSRERALIGPANWGWVDAKHQFARIPIDEAINLAVTGGLPQNLPATQPSSGFMPPASALHGPGGVP